MTDRRKQILGMAMAGIAALLMLTGCSQKALEPFKDAPTQGRNNAPATVIEMPDGFNNLASKCDGPNRVYVTYHSDSPYGAVSVVKDDPRCKQP